MKKAAIVGYGNMGSQYADKIYSGEIEGLSLYGILCRNQAGQQKIRENMGDVKIFLDEESMFGQAESFDALIITTPHKEHIRVVEKAQKAGLHILCEKPFGTTARECLSAVAAAEKSNQVCALMFNWRAREIYRRVKRYLDDNKLGCIHQVVWIANFWYRPAFYHQASAWRSSWSGEGGGLLINQCQHLMDMWNWLFGQPNQVSAQIDYGCYNNIQVDDKVSLFFSHDNGMWGTFIASTGDFPGSNRLEIHGEMGKLVVEGDCCMTVWENEESTSVVSRTAQEMNPVIPCHQWTEEVHQDKNEYVVLLQNFAESMEGKAYPAAVFADGLRALQNANAAYLSDWQCRKMPIPCDNEAYMRELEKRIQNER